MTEPAAHRTEDDKSSLHETWKPDAAVSWILVVVGPFLLLGTSVLADVLQSAKLLCWKASTMAGSEMSMKCIAQHFFSAQRMHELLVKLITAIWRSYAWWVGLLLLLKISSAWILSGITTGKAR